MSPDGVAITVGEPADGLEGWRFSHAQAKAAMPMAERRGAPVVRFIDVAVEAAIVRDEVIATSLRRRYLRPLETARDGGAAARETLRAYFAAERNVSADRGGARGRPAHGPQPARRRSRSCSADR